MTTDPEALRLAQAMLPSLMSKTAQLRITETGRMIAGITHRNRWVYWSRTESRVVCERCGTQQPTIELPGVVTAADVVKIANTLTPFAREHARCERRPDGEQPRIIGS